MPNVLSTPPLSPLRRAALPRLTPHLLSDTWREPAIGIVHLGLGSFHRAHQALYTEEAMLAEGGDWGICGVTLQGSVEKRDALVAQDGLYTVVERGPAGVRTTVARALREVLALPHDRARLFALLADARVRIVSLTVTEKGYCRDTRTGDIDREHAGVIADLAHPDAPVTVPGILTAALRQRRLAGIAPFTVMSCDNLAHNGAALRKVVCSYARLRDAALAEWIEAAVAFPSTMVDRIVPATTDADRVTASESLGLHDALPVPCEPFRQWVIEDTFPSGRPAWDRTSAQLVDDVLPFEIAKLRMLNGAHSTLAYLSMLAGFETIDVAIGHAPMHAFIHALMTHEIIPTLQANPAFDPHAYRDALLTRFANPALKHRCAQIAMDGSQKIPPRLLATIDARLQRHAPITGLALAVGAWFVFLRGQADDGTRYDISDPLAARLQGLARQVQPDAWAPGNEAALVDALLGCQDVFPPALAARADFRRPLIDAVRTLQAGARQAIANVHVHGV
ncbi:mannitol dehydrogenase family protein [Robbsia sp. Bb-Pol-6]|uniref:Mannitol dehydrogenase family protein n=1 Tax=Robbsia betulipollinis TaxID=2981849 RepID=A0ABT3ZSX8_9BURK|nr:mannitol dehydrogenase family protein [Robbsia betulipollinis]MCY0389577.1 mannitol dehydrogenase family protein [Robbsia betulipollinis]